MNVGVVGCEWVVVSDKRVFQGYKVGMLGRREYAKYERWFDERHIRDSQRLVHYMYGINETHIVTEMDEGIRSGIKCSEAIGIEPSYR